MPGKVPYFRETAPIFDQFLLIFSKRADSTLELQYSLNVDYED